MAPEWNWRCGVDRESACDCGGGAQNSFYNWDSLCSTLGHTVWPSQHACIYFAVLCSALFCSTTVTHNRKYKTNAVNDAHLLFFFFHSFILLFFYCQPDTIIGHSKMWYYLQRQTCFAKSTFSQILIVQQFPWFPNRGACDVHWFVMIFNHYFFALNLYIDIYELLCRTKDWRNFISILIMWKLNQCTELTTTMLSFVFLWSCINTLILKQYHLMSN